MDKALKQQVHTLVLQRNYDDLIALCQESNQAWKILRTNIYETDENLIWQTIEAIVRLMERWWELGNEEKVREYIRNLFWSINDESGGIGWNAPQTIAEIIVRIPELVEPYGTMVVDRTIDEPLLVNSCLWAMGRLGNRLEGKLTLFEESILETFKSSSPETLGLVAWATGEMHFLPARAFLEKLVDRSESVKIYIQGTYHEKTMGEWAHQSIGKLA